jgi:hypothetical protein
MKEKRNSGIELLKVIAMFGIVLSHVCQTLYSDNSYINYHGYMLDLGGATTNLQQLILSICKCFGELGNNIFFVCSAWFLLESHKVNLKKWFFILVEVWCVSVAICCLCVGIMGNVSPKLILYAFIPTTSGKCWYVTCYLLFYLMHVILNRVIDQIDKAELFRSSFILAVLYLGIGFIKRDLFFTSNLIQWVAIYFVVAYIKLYLKDTIACRKVNLSFLCIGIFGYLSLVLATNFLGLRLESASEMMLHWASNQNPFLIMIALAAFQLARQSKLESRSINYVSGLILLIYVIHENMILRTYCRPYLVNFIYERLGYDYILPEMLLLAIMIFIVTMGISILYDVSLRKFVKSLSVKVYQSCRSVGYRVEQLVLDWH